jgi:hypothetical protein
MFQWSALTGATAYQLDIALDSAFTQALTSWTGITTTNIQIGPNAPAPNAYEFQEGTTYYWRVRATAPVFSPYASYWSFTVGHLSVLSIISPESGATDVPIQVIFIWTPVRGAKTYDIAVSQMPDFSLIDFTRSSNQPYFPCDVELEYDTTYYWRVSTGNTPPVYGVFTTQAEPTVPVTTPIITTVLPTPTLTVTLPEPVEAVPTFLLWIIVAIGAILVIALIVLIVRTRRAA